MITHTPIPSWYQGVPLPLQATVTDDNHVETVMLFLTSSTSNWLVLTMESVGENIYETTIPANEMTGSLLEYFILARDTVGRESRLYSVGDEGFILPLSPFSPTLILTIIVSVVIIVIVIIFAVWYLRRKPAK